MFGGSVQGVFRRVEPNKRIQLDWRFRWAGQQQGSRPGGERRAPLCCAGFSCRYLALYFGRHTLPSTSPSLQSRPFIFSDPCSNWEEGVYSKVDLRFEEPDRGNTRVTLKQVGSGVCARRMGQSVGLVGGVWGVGDGLAGLGLCRLPTCRETMRAEPAAA
jgi:uncharacterized protein YndB with AHSA1/START domain